MQIKDKETWIKKYVMVTLCHIYKQIEVPTQIKNRFI